MSSEKTKLYKCSGKCNSQDFLKRRNCKANCMDSKSTGGGPTSAVKVFTVFMLSGSLFLLIYNVGRRRMNMITAHSHSVREPVPPVIANPSTLRGYFSHYKDKPLPHHRKPSLTAALDTFSSTTSNIVEGNVTPRSDHTDPDSGAVPEAPTTEWLHNNPSATPGGSSSRSYDPETGPYMLTRRYNSGVSQAFSITNLDPSNSTATGHEGQMIEHMRRRTSLSDFRGSTNGSDMRSDPKERRASCTFLGDMSQLETNVLGPVMEHIQNTFDISPRISTETDARSDDSDWPRSSSPHSVSTKPHKQFMKPLIYIFIWSVLSYSVDMYSSTGWGAKMTGFPAPFLKATVHFLTQAIMSSCMLRWPGSNVFAMPWNTYMFVAPIATAAVLDHDLWDASSFTVTLGIPIFNKPVGILEHAYMMFSSVKDATLETVWDTKMQSKGYMPVCVFLFALAFRLESRSVAVAMSIAVMTVGFIFGVSSGNKFWVTSLKDSSFGPLLSGLRWAAIQVLLQRRELGVVTPVVTMRALSPSMAMVAAVLSLVVEPWSNLLTTEYFDDPDNALKSCGHIMIGALLGTAMALAELVVVYHTSALTLIILGMLKDLCVVVPRMIYASHFSEQNMLGLTVFTIGLVSLVWIKYQNLMKKNRVEGPSDEAQSVVSGTSTDRWSGIRAYDFAGVVAPVQRFRGYLARAYGACAGVPRKLRALWSEYRERRRQS